MFWELSVQVTELLHKYRKDIVLRPTHSRSHLYLAAKFDVMDIETFYEYCMSMNGVEETFPFGEQTLVFKVMGKMFALTNLEGEIFKVNLKCNPTYAEELREKHPEVQPGFHMNKKHWNTVSFQENLEGKTLKHLIDHSYELVVNKLKKADRELLESMSKKPNTNV